MIVGYLKHLYPNLALLSLPLVQFRSGKGGDVQASESVLHVEPELQIRWYFGIEWVDLQACSPSLRTFEKVLIRKL